MMIDDDTLKQLLRINDELLQLCKFLNEKRDMANFIPPNTPGRRPDPHSDRSGQKQIAVMQAYKDISSRALRSWFIRSAVIGTSAATFVCPATLVQSWRSGAFSFSSSP
jgi:hypothetical protein